MHSNNYFYGFIVLVLSAAVYGQSDLPVEPAEQALIRQQQREHALLQQNTAVTTDVRLTKPTDLSAMTYPPQESPCVVIKQISWQDHIKNSEYSATKR